MDRRGRRKRIGDGDDDGDGDGSEGREDRLAARTKVFKRKKKGKGGKLDEGDQKFQTRVRVLQPQRSWQSTLWLVF